jgi:hypothetical protein
MPRQTPMIRQALASRRKAVSMRAIVLPHRDSWFNTADMIPERRAAE